VAICADIASPARLQGKEIIYTDYELDVVKRAGEPVAIEDEDEFREAAILYGYSDAFQDECRRLVDRVREIVDDWIPIGLSHPGEGVRESLRAVAGSCPH